MFNDSIEVIFKVLMQLKIQTTHQKKDHKIFLVSDTSVEEHKNSPPSLDYCGTAVDTILSLTMCSHPREFSHIE
jgi:hypothetical protein